MTTIAALIAAGTALSLFLLVVTVTLLGSAIRHRQHGSDRTADRHATRALQAGILMSLSATPTLLLIERVLR